MSLEDTFTSLASFLNSLDAEGEQKFELSHSLVIICPDCGKNIAFRGRCPKCGGNSWIPAGHAGGIFERMKAQRWRQMITDDDDTLTRRAAAEPAKPKRAAKLSYKDQRELDGLPARIDALGAEAVALEKKLADPALYQKDPAGFAGITRALGAKRAELAAAEERWLELEAQREALESGRADNGELTS